MLNDLLALPLETQIFVVAIFVVAVWFHRRFDAKTAANGPTILTTIGIFATFFAIAMGLKNFDSTNIQNSIPDLLNNLKTAFWASVAGVGAALTLKGREHIWGHSIPKGEQQAPDEVGAVEIVRGLGRVEHALVGGEEGSLISQVKLLRSESRDELRRLGDAQAKALEKLSEMGSKTLIEALKDVIRDFNKNLTEQFGENFKELNAAVGKLVQWQEQYRRHVEYTAKKLGEMQAAFERTAADYANVVEKSTAFAKVSEDLGLVVKDMEVRHKMLVGQNEALGNLLKEASGSLPEIEKKMVELARQLAEGLSENRRVLDVALKEHVATIQSGAQAASEGIRKTSEDSAQVMARVAANANEHLAATAKQLQERSDENQKAIGRAMQEHATAFAGSIKASVDSAIAVAADQGKRLMEATAKTQTEVVGHAKELSKTLVESQQTTAKTIADGAESLRQSMKSTVDSMAAANNAQNQQLAEIASKVRSEVVAHAKDLSKSLAESQQTTAKTMAEGAESLRQSMKSTIDAMVAANNTQNQQLAEIASKTKEQVATLDKALGEELERSLRSLGEQLTALSARFVRDYQPLTDTLARFVEAAKRGAGQ